MKKLVKVLALVVVAAIACLALASCGGLSGTYENKGVFGLGATELTFKGNKITIETLGHEAEGTYKIDGDEIKIEIEDNDEDEASWDDLLKAWDGTFDFEKEDDYIKINGVKYEKAD